MTRSGQIVALLTETPGMTMREVFVALGGDYAYNAVAAQLSTMAKAGKLRRDATATRGGRYWLTELAGKDMRSDPNRAGKRSRAAKVAAATRLKGPKPETRAAMRARIHAECRPKEKQVKRDRFIQAPRLAMKRPAESAQTVEQFKASGGRVQILAPHEASNPLRFDHSQTQVPIAMRRASTRCRPAPGR